MARKLAAGVPQLAVPDEIISQIERRLFVGRVLRAAQVAGHHAGSHSSARASWMPLGGLDATALSYVRYVAAVLVQVELSFMLATSGPVFVCIVISS